VGPIPEPISYYHLSGAMLAPGSIILPGNWGRMLTAWGWQHNQSLRELALEDARVARFPHRPSRLQSAFVLPTLANARDFRRLTVGFEKHILYRVTLVDPTALSHVTESRFCGPQGTVRHNWADVYWMDHAAQAGSVPGIPDWNAAIGGVPLPEMLTLSQLRVEERLD
jgi:hypothetical protein